LSTPKDIPTRPGGWEDFWKTPMIYEVRSLWLRDPRPDNDLAGDILREEQRDASVRQGERERYGL
jgi:hypothetical protein